MRRNLPSRCCNGMPARPCSISRAAILRLGRPLNRGWCGLLGLQVRACWGGIEQPALCVSAVSKWTKNQGSTLREPQTPTTTPRSPRQLPNMCFRCVGIKTSGTLRSPVRGRRRSNGNTPEAAEMAQQSASGQTLPQCGKTLSLRGAGFATPHQLATHPDRTSPASPLPDEVAANQDHGIQCRIVDHAGNLVRHFRAGCRVCLHPRRTVPYPRIVQIDGARQWSQ